MASDWWLAATVLRLMHENQLLSPNRHPPRPANDHDGTILTTAPDRLWGTDASMVQTVADAAAVVAHLGQIVHLQSVIARSPVARPKGHALPG